MQNWKINMAALESNKSVHNIYCYHGYQRTFQKWEVFLGEKVVLKLYVFKSYKYGMPTFLDGLMNQSSTIVCLY